MTDTEKNHSLQGDNKRIAKNTLLLYIRMLLILFVSLYTSRIILNILGIEDFGIYNVIGGVVILFSFINNTLIITIQRFLNFELGKNNFQEAKRVFSMSVSVHIFISIIILIFAETIGLWFINTQLNFPSERMHAVNWVYQLSIITLIIQLLRIPYYATIVAYEKMSFFTYISIFETSVKLLSVLLLTFFVGDKLVLYSIFILFFTIAISYIYKIYCNKKTEISSYNFFFDRVLFRKISSFSSWSLFGSLANVSAQQGLNFMINIFYGVVVNASMGIANQISANVYNFVANFQTAFNPQLVKRYASGNKASFMQLLFQSSKFSYYLLFAISFPAVLYMDFIIKLWLGQIPEYVVSFSRLILVFLLIEAISAPLWMAVQAHGKIMTYQFIISFTIIMAIPFSYIALKLGYRPECVLIIRIVINLIVYSIRIIYLKLILDLNVKKYIKQVIIIPLVITIISIPIPLITAFNTDGWKGFIITTFLSLLTFIFFVYKLGLNQKERTFITNILINKINRFIKQ